MRVILDTATVQTLVSPMGSTNSITRAIFSRQYNAALLGLYKLRNQLEEESPQLVQESGFAHAMDVLKNCPSNSQKVVLHYPTFGFWLDVAFELVRRRSHLLFPEMHVLRHLQGFWRYVLATVLHAKKGEISCSLLTDSEGRIALPGMNIYFQTNPFIAYQHMEVHICDGELTAYNLSNGGKTQVPLTQHSIVSLDVGFQLNDIDGDLRLAGRTSLDYDKITDHTFQEWNAIVAKAWAWISTASPLIAEEIPLGIQVLVPIRSSSPLVHLSGSYREAPGLVTMSWSPDVFVIAEALVHEYHHQKLNALLDIDPIIIGPTPLPLFYSPWRKDPRPLTGLLHAVYTFQGILEFCNRLLNSDTPLLDRFRIQKRIYQTGQQVRVGLASLMEYADLSPLGKSLMAAISNNLETQFSRTSELDADTQQRIDTTLAVHRREWDAQHGHVIQRRIDLHRHNIRGVYLKAVSKSSISRIEQEVLNFLGLPQSYDSSEFVGQDIQSDSVLAAIRNIAYERGVDILMTFLKEVVPGNSLLLDLFAGHSYYVAADYLRAANHYKACIERNPEISYFWQCYAFALRHLGDWDTSLLILTNLDSLIESDDHAKTDGNSSVNKRLARIMQKGPAILPPDVADVDDLSHASTSSRPGKLPLASIFRNSKIESFFEFAPMGTQLPAFLSVIYGLKPAMDIWIPRHGWSAFQELVSRFGLHYHLDTYFDRFAENVTSIPYDQLTTTRAAFCRSYESQADAHVFIARTRELLNNVVADGWYPLVVNKRIVHKHLADHDKFGNSLGYPDCCQEFFRLRNNWYYDNTYYAAYKNTAGTPSLYANGFMRHTAFGLIHHMACSFRCEATMASATKLHDLITSEYPEYGKEIERQLKSPILCLSELRIYQFMGRLDSPTRVHYDHVEIIHPTQVNDDVYRLLKLGNSCSVDGNLLRIYRDGQQIATYFARADHHGPELPFLIQCS